MNKKMIPEKSKTDQQMIISLKSTEESQIVESEYIFAGKKHNVFFRSLGDTKLSGNPESCIATAILPAMKTGCKEIITTGEVSQRFLTSLATIQYIYKSWNQALTEPTITGLKPIQKSRYNKNRVGLFFSGGVDSFYSLLKHQDEITDIIFVHGFDIKLENKILREKVFRRIKKVGEQLDKNVIEIETNIQHFFKTVGGLNWGEYGHGAALAATGHLLSPLFCRIYIASSHERGEVIPWGSHYVLDHLWSSEDLEFVHDGFGYSRIKKVAFISNYKIALENLRVCWKNPDNSYNCGECEKCLRTMINLKISNALEKCTTFDKEINYKQISKLIINKEFYGYFIKSNIIELEKTEGNDELIKVLKKLLSQPTWTKKFKKRWTRRKNRLINIFKSWFLN